MVKRRDLLDELRRIAKDRGEEMIEVEGANHTKVKIGDRQTVVARHTEIPELTAKKIRKQIGGAP